MVKLKDLVNVNINRDTITIQGVEFPVIFTMESFMYLEEAYGKPYKSFEKELNKTLKNGEIELNQDMFKLAYALIYAMVRAGGTECTIEELKGAIPVLEIPDIFKKVMSIFTNQIFQKEDMEKIKSEKKN